VNKLPTQLKWPQFVRALTSLGFRQLPSKGGSARHFQRFSDKTIHTVHEPHGGDTLRLGTLTEYLRHMDISREKFLQALDGTVSIAEQTQEDRFRRTQDVDGTIISNCNQCLNLVIKSKIEDEVIAAERRHPCYMPADK
jgi:predicted RNA binding protein YcfA (HicA-like mRNA interferase family)